MMEPIFKRVGDPREHLVRANERMTTGRINQVATLFNSLEGPHETQFQLLENVAMSNFTTTAQQTKHLLLK